MPPIKKRPREESVKPAPQKAPSSPRRLATVYDAVAGRVGYEAFLSAPKPTSMRDTTSTSAQPVAPEEVLFRRKNAPIRYEEDDAYFANRHLGPDQKLPDSDLLKHIHAYAARFYQKATKNGGRRDWRSMDETALLAMGILLEESAKEVIGETGDLAFLEGEGADDGSSGMGPGKGRMVWNGERWVRSVLERKRYRDRKGKKRSTAEDDDEDD